jgi:hypothetical protein
MADLGEHMSKNERIQSTPMPLRIFNFVLVANLRESDGEILGDLYYCCSRAGRFVGFRFAKQDTWIAIAKERQERWFALGLNLCLGFCLLAEDFQIFACRADQMPDAL